MEQIIRRESLAAARRARSHTHESLAERLGLSPHTVSAWERGTRKPRPQHRLPLARELDVSLEELDLMIDPSAETTLSSHEVSPDMSLYDSLVSGAGQLNLLEKSVVPALFQTPGYALVVESWNPEPTTDQQRRASVEVRMRRQQALHREVGALQVRCLLSEAVLLAEVGGESVMRQQLERLLELTDHPAVDLRLLPHDGRDTAAPSGFQIFYRPNEPRPFLAVTFDVHQPQFLVRTDTIAAYGRVYDHLASHSLPPHETANRILEITTRYQF